jgi:hypothetical protein
MATHEFLKSARVRTKDSLLVLKAKGTVATSMVGESPVGTDKTFDTGGGRTRGDMIIDVYATPAILASTKFVMRQQGGKNSSFSTLTDLVITELGDATQITSDVDLTTGRYIVPFSNDFDDTIYRYLRHYISCVGTCGTGIQYDCYIGKIYS